MNKDIAPEGRVRRLQGIGSYSLFVVESFICYETRLNIVDKK
ncbi:hypothetical protein [Variovorax boronicumulans]